MAVSDLSRQFRNTIQRSAQAFIRTESLDTDGTTYAIAGVDTTSNTFTISGDETGDPNLQSGNRIYGNGTTGNDAVFEIDSVSLDGNGDTAVSVKESIEDSTADGNLVMNVDFEYINLGRIKNAEVSSDLQNSEEDQDGRMSSNLYGFEANLALMQASNVELSTVPDLNRPPIDGPDGADLGTYPRGYRFYENGHFIYFSGDSTVESGTVNSAVADDPVSADDGELLTDNGNYNLSDDTNGIMFQNVLFSVGPSLDLSGGENILPVSFEGVVEFDALKNLNTTRKILVSPSNFYNYA